MKVSLFVTCIVDQMFPQVGAASVELLARLGVEVRFNPEQTCCGQPAFNSGCLKEARDVARHMLDVFEGELKSADYIVAPSGSCVTMNLPPLCHVVWLSFWAQPQIPQPIQPIFPRPKL